jgi:DNA topoisomerase-1
MPRARKRAAAELAARLATSSRQRLRRVGVEELAIRRRRDRNGFIYVNPRGKVIRDDKTVRRLKRLAVPPAYEDVRFAEDPDAHIQAVGRDSAGRTQYRYHAQWDEVRERRKARRLLELVKLLPDVRAALARYLRRQEPSREFALAAVIDLIACTALRPGSEAYAREHGTRGAATLLQSDVTVKGDTVSLCFCGKGGKTVKRIVRSRRLARTVKYLKRLPGRRLFQYRAEDGSLNIVRRRDVNAFLHEIASEHVSLKDFRTMIACARALENLVAFEPKPTMSGRRRQLKRALCAVSEELANTPAICRKSYVHRLVIEAFETGALRSITTRARAKATSGEDMLRIVLKSA